MHLRDLFNEMKWHRKELYQAMIVIRHRGAAEDEKWISGDAIELIGTSFFTYQGEFEQTEIPYHRVLRVLVDDDVLFDRADL